jgi:hypothetical protein
LSPSASLLIGRANSGFGQVGLDALGDVGWHSGAKKLRKRSWRASSISMCLVVMAGLWKDRVSEAVALIRLNAARMRLLHSALWKQSTSRQSINPWSATATNGKDQMQAVTNADTAAYLRIV